MVTGHTPDGIAVVASDPGIYAGAITADGSDKLTASRAPLVAEPDDRLGYRVGVFRQPGRLVGPRQVNRDRPTSALWTAQHLPYVMSGTINLPGDVVLRTATAHKIGRRNRGGSEHQTVRRDRGLAADVEAGGILQHYITIGL